MFGDSHGLGNARCVVEVRLEANALMFVLKVEEAPALWSEESALT